MSSRLYDLPPLAQLEAFEAAARHLSFTKAADELALTQSAVSRQIAAIEERLGTPLFRRMHRALALTAEGETLARAVGDVLRRLHHVTGQIRGSARARTVVVTTTAGLASLWLIPRLARFSAREPDVDVRISTGQAVVPLDRDGVDLAIRYVGEGSAGAGAQLLFGERAFPVCTPALRDDPTRPLHTPADLRRHVLLHIETGAGLWALEWPLWLRAVGLPDLQPARAMHFSQYDQLIAAALGGQGVALGRSPIVDALLAEGRLVAPFTERLDTARAYYVVQSSAARHKPEVQAFVQWLHEEAAGGR
jgi:LysR family glycine cleavage system transcriptional activator